MYYALYKQLTGKAKSQQHCSEEFGFKMTPFKHLVTGKKQPCRPFRGNSMTGKSSQTTEEVKQLESGEAKTWKEQHRKEVRLSKIPQNTLGRIVRLGRLGHANMTGRIVSQGLLGSGCSKDQENYN